MASQPSCIMISAEFQSFLERSLSEKLGEPVRIHSADPKGGGSINAAAVLRTSAGPFFVKWNDASRHKGMFEAEARGLSLLKAAGELKAPDPIATGDDGQYCFIILEFLEQGEPSFGFWEDFGMRLARQHRHTSERFGLDHDNFVGSLPQKNAWVDNWPDFFVRYRLEPQLRRAVDSGKADQSIVQRFENLYARLPEIFPEEPPALLHGDLWGGNFLCTLEGEPAIFDPAVYYGHREMDLAMTRLFGGFDYEFYEGYINEYPLAPGWEKRVDICNLYPLLVHVNLFPGSYIQSVKNILSRF
ncbi:MAG: fructosamine kinase family protein [Flavobacteriales bacterium]|nr:fructosamine kinase family protein [Flavobacteriales bacterium]MCX7768888.1 fructosamine kinase family protein [Flavobacteriales bacterium]MDW8410014.1 fructosamine kinase family protein [Flavobacteriales bacterium]